MRDQLQDALHRVAKLEERLSSMAKPGTVHEVHKDKIRVNHGTGADGQPLLGPWIHTGNHRGGSTERRFYKKGMNVMMFSPSGDPRQAMLFPYAPNKNFKPPEHADDTGDSADTFQLGSLRGAKVDGGFEIWLAGGGSGGSSGAAMNLRIEKDGGITGKVGDTRFAAHKDGVKLKHKSGGSIFVDKDGCWSSKPMQVKDDPIPDDDKNGFKTGSSSSQSSGSSGGGTTGGT